MSDSPQPSFANGKICYLEIPARNVEQSANFYKNVFGWNIRKHDNGRVAFDDSTGQVSGMWVTDKEPSTDPTLIISIMVGNLKNTINLIEKNNGKLVRMRDEHPEEVLALFADPAGNVLCIYQDQAANKTL